MEFDWTVICENWRINLEGGWEWVVWMWRVEYRVRLNGRRVGLCDLVAMPISVISAGTYSLLLCQMLPISRKPRLFFFWFNFICDFRSRLTVSYAFIFYFLKKETKKIFYFGLIIKSFVTKHYSYWDFVVHLFLKNK